MASSKQNFDEISTEFYNKMAEFQKKLDTATQSQAVHTINSIAEEFASFKLFIMSSLRTLQQQIDGQAKQIDKMEMRSRRKMLLVHGIPESKSEDISGSLLKLFTDHVHTVEVTAVSISKCHRLGRFNSNKTRPIIVKFKDADLRDKIWYTKTVFKGTGVTLSEFLTLCRHQTLMEARRRFGVTNCWSKEGMIIIMGPDGSRHRASCTKDLDVIPMPEPVATVPVSGASSQCKDGKNMSSQRSKRTGKQK